MSIHNLFNKIKGLNNVDKSMILQLMVIIGVGVSAFGLGRISAVNDNNYIKKDESTSQIASAVKQSELSHDIPIEKNINEVNPDLPKNTTGNNYLASKNGKLYYTVTCKGAKRIKDENKVWFKTATDAEKSGYKRANSCK